MTAAGELDRDKYSAAMAELRPELDELNREMRALTKERDELSPQKKVENMVWLLRNITGESSSEDAAPRRF